MTMTIPDMRGASQLSSAPVQSHVMACHLQKHRRINVLTVKELLIIAFLVQARIPFEAMNQGLHSIYTSLVSDRLGYIHFSSVSKLTLAWAIIEL